MTAQTGRVRLTHDGAIATIWLDRPGKRNAMSYGMWDALHAVTREVASDPAVRVVVLRGAGGHFSAGADITELGLVRPHGEPSFADVNIAAEAALAAIPKPTVAFVTGDCIGGGCAMAIDCDLRIAASTARLGITPSKLGVVYPSASLERVTQLLGPAAAKRLLFTGDVITATEALRIGLIDEVVEAAASEERLAALTGDLAARSLLTQASTKSMIADIVATGTVSPGVRDRWQRIAADAADLAEGVAAFSEKRPPRFTWTGPHAD